jgi:leucine-rich repeat protein SHOC2
LRTLQLNRNRIARLPREIGLLSRLEELGLAENRLRSLPPTIGRLRSLLHLYLQQNQLTALPPEVATLPSLEALFVRGNPLPRKLALPRSLGRLIRTFPYELGWQPSVQSG